ncbi:MAG: ribose 5-phosphate isomerase B [Chitinophagales bacterium]|nr:ribose 5-phosphate isomerase B [Chitinophagales bacterium]MDW8427232.1 ribose 5-phosphate isomerase B [Chitinophagales bacterium]
MERKKIAIGSDHAGYVLKQQIKAWLEQQGHEVRDFGTYSEQATDYPDVVHPLCQAMERGDLAAGILLCGSGNGVAMTANKYAHIRAALCWSEEVARLARSHNDANVLCLPARFITSQAALSMVEKFLATPFEGGRHQRRVEKIAIGNFSCG